MRYITDLLKQLRHLFAMGTKLIQHIIESNYYDTFVFHLCNKAILQGYKILECSNFQFSKHKTSVGLSQVDHIGINLTPFKIHILFSIQMSNSYQYNTTSSYIDLSSKVFEKVTLTRIWVSYEVQNDFK